jgi:hypothetical protein
MTIKEEILKKIASITGLMFPLDKYYAIEFDSDGINELADYIQRLLLERELEVSKSYKAFAFRYLCKEDYNRIADKNLRIVNKAQKQLDSLKGE